MTPVMRLQGLRTHHVGPIDLDLPSGEITLISGASGSGKSLLLRAIADLDPHTGTILLGDAELQSIDAPAWRRQVGYIPSESHWWGERVDDHLNAGCAPLLNQLGFTADCLDWRIDRLSSGERQRLALARMLALQPRVLLLDEATANLDDRNARTVERLISSYVAEHQASALWVSHDRMQRQRIGHRHMRMDQGKLIEEPR